MQWTTEMLPWSTFALLGQAWAAPPQTTQVETAAWTSALSLVALTGEPLGAQVLDGKLVLFVNVASRCGFTSQYDGLQALWEKYEARGLVIVGVPCNQFGNQEPGKAEEIITFCRANYGVNFPLLEKQDVKGDTKSPLYAHLVDSALAGGAEVKWNFEKFLVSPQGEVLARFRSKTSPDDPELIQAIEKGLSPLH
jgi:glutathione peroxidase